MDAPADVAIATSTGARAIQANVGTPNFGKLAASRRPERIASG
jgi:hypothetical protein